MIGRRLELAALRADGSEFPIEMSITATVEGGRQLPRIHRRRHRAPRAGAGDAPTGHDRAGELRAIIVKDADGTVIEWNPGAERLYGYSADQVVGHPISILVPPERSGDEIKLLRRALGGAVITQFETERLRRDGTRVEVSLTISPIHDAQGEPARASVIARHIGERKQAKLALCASQEDLRRQSELLAGVIENALIGMAIVSPKGRWLHVNRSLSEIVGYSEAELPQMSFQEVTHPDDRDSHRAMVEQLLAGEVGSHELEKRYVRKDAAAWQRTG